MGGSHKRELGDQGRQGRQATQNLKAQQIRRATPRSPKGEGQMPKKGPGRDLEAPGEAGCRESDGGGSLNTKTGRTVPPPWPAGPLPSTVSLLSLHPSTHVSLVASGKTDAFSPSAGNICPTFPQKKINLSPGNTIFNKYVCVWPARAVSTGPRQKTGSP